MTLMIWIYKHILWEHESMFYICLLLSDIHMWTFICIILPGNYISLYINNIWAKYIERIRIVFRIVHLGEIVNLKIKSS